MDPGQASESVTCGGRCCPSDGFPGNPALRRRIFRPGNGNPEPGDGNPCQSDGFPGSGNGNQHPYPAPDFATDPYGSASKSGAGFYRIRAGNRRQSDGFSSVGAGFRRRSSANPRRILRASAGFSDGFDHPGARNPARNFPKSAPDFQARRRKSRAGRRKSGSGRRKSQAHATQIPWLDLEVLAPDPGVG